MTKAAFPPARGRPPGSARFPPRARISKGHDIRRVMARGARKRTPHLDVFLAPSASPVSRVGVIVPKHRRRIVERNLLKRRLREIARREVLPRIGALPAAMDVLIRARGEAYGEEFGVLCKEIATLARQLPRGRRAEAEDS